MMLFPSSSVNTCCGTTATLSSVKLRWDVEKKATWSVVRNSVDGFENGVLYWNLLIKTSRLIYVSDA